MNGAATRPAPGRAASVPGIAPEARILDRAGLFAWGRRLGAEMSVPRVVTISGDLGAGKTTLVQAICDGFGVTEPVTSPTFALVHEYWAPRGVVLHLDLYRLEDARSLDSIGFDELMERDALVLVEWPERAAGRLPVGCVGVTLASADRASERVVSVDAS